MYIMEDTLRKTFITTIDVSSILDTKDLLDMVEDALGCSIMGYCTLYKVKTIENIMCSLCNSILGFTPVDNTLDSILDMSNVLDNSIYRYMHNNLKQLAAALNDMDILHTGVMILNNNARIYITCE